ncbi:hypothetical protein D4764_0122210 [Takifugu flavidus]|uniref:Uncharacterized protein n=1 Tax=Takifugu flavidus TaxID=433684 RepID=A0A5C6MFZ5_9TELE|nr:hypothetical protein D4764_0122210 [Takifugu flavidus]
MVEQICSGQGPRIWSEEGRRTPEAAGCSKNHTLDPNSVEADSKRQVCNRLPDLLLTVDCLFNEGKLLSSKHNKAAYMEIIKLIATSYQGYANKIHVCSSPQKVPAPELCVSFTPVLHQLVTSHHLYYGINISRNHLSNTNNPPYFSEQR